VQAGRKFTWVHARAEVLRSLTDITYSVRFLALARLKRQTRKAAKLWISKVLTRKALLEDPKLPAPVLLPEALYLELLVGQMSAQETTIFDYCPSIGDDLSARDARGRLKYTLERIKRSIDDCSSPPQFRGVMTPVTDLLDQSDVKPKDKEKRAQVKDKGGKDEKSKSKDKEKRDQSRNPANAHLARRPDHEQPSKFPTGLKRPDLEAIVDGNKIASEAQRQLYDDIKRGNCTRCHKDGHIRKDCKEPKAKWVEKFDKEKGQYWESVVKWQAKATTSPKPSPTLHEKPAPKPEQRASSIASDSDDDFDPTFPPLHYRMTIDDESDDDDASPPIAALVAGIGEVDMFDDPGLVAPSPAQLEAIFATSTGNCAPPRAPYKLLIHPPRTPNPRSPSRRSKTTRFSLS
jgi:hypothetical protein